MAGLNYEKALFSPTNAAHVLDVSRTTVYELMKHGLIKFVAFGSERRIPADEIKRLVAEGIPSIPRRAKTDLIGVA